MSEKELPASATKRKETPKQSANKSSNGRSSRVEELAKPKMSKAEWLTSYHCFHKAMQKYRESLVWGNQEPLWPVSRAAMKAVPSDRVEVLAKSKANSQEAFPDKCSRPEFQYSCGRPSVIWEVSPAAMKGQPSERIEMLSRHKTAPAGFTEDRSDYPLGCGRSSPIWEVSEKTKNASERPETNRLAIAKRTHPSYIPCKEVQWPVSQNAMRHQANTRVEDLARPKSRSDGQLRDPQWVIRKATLKADASARIQELAKPKQLSERYVPDRDVEWRVHRLHRKSYLSERLKALSQPIIRESMDIVQFNPDAFKIREAAKKAVISARVNELAQPIQRGMRISTA